MRRMKSLASSIFVSISLATVTLMVAAQSQQPNPSPPAIQPQQPSPPQSGYVLKVKTRLITVDVVATDSHGDAIRDLKQEEFEVSDNGPQKVAQFAFIDLSANAAAAKPAAEQPEGNRVYSNRVPPEKLAIPPTVLLMDALNTPISDQQEVRTQMVRLLKTIPPHTQIAVFLLGSRLSMVQNFTSDPALLQAAADKAQYPSTLLAGNPADDPQSLSQRYLTGDSMTGDEDFISRTLEDFEKEQYGQMMDLRVEMTADALTEIAHFLTGYPGRKNLIWFTSSFPAAILPSLGVGTDTLRGSRSYSERIQNAANAVTDAQVAIYPVSASGLETSTVFEASQQGITGRRRTAGGGFGQQLSREDNARAIAEGSMDEISEGTGGKTCRNTNDLSGCVQRALKDSSSYYELAYYPQNIKWDGSFHKIGVKTTRHGVKLSYRRGYFAQDSEALAKQQPSVKHLQQVCSALLPSTAIPIMAQPAPQTIPGELRYLLAIPLDALSLGEEGESRGLNMQLAVCEFAAKGDSFQFFPRDLTQQVSYATYQAWQAQGFQEYVDVPPKTDTRRVRLAVLDMRTGLTGSVDIPVHPEDLNRPIAPAATPAASHTARSQPHATHSFAFHSTSGADSLLDWSGDKLWYHGDVAIERSVPAFFHYTFGARYHCEAGSLVPMDNSAAGGAPPSLRMTFTSPGGQSAIVDLHGEQPEYSGGLPVDPSAKPFFARLWYFCHCTAPK